jgi:hypothetical protein
MSKWKLFLVALAFTAARSAWGSGMDLDRDPVRYSTAPANNTITRLQERIDAGKARLSYEENFGYLPSLLRELKIPLSSQMLVFSKTSMQQRRIGPRTPRALYFADDAYIGFCQKGTVIEVTAVDPQLGSVFYTLEQKPNRRPQLTRQTETCLTCHGSSHNDGLPGHMARSLFVDESGYGILSAGSTRVDHTTPLEKRWGGWYVTGTSGKQKHLGNLISEDREQPEQVDNTQGVNVTRLSDRFNTAAYLTPHSDIVALMVMEHQTAVHNLLTRANFLTRWAVQDAVELNKALGKPADYQWESTQRRIKNAGDPLVKFLLLGGEAPLAESIRGTSGFSEEFAKQGPRDSHGRSLRDLDLKKRLFRYPCSYLVYSPSFDALPAPVRDYVLHRLHDVLTGKDTSTDFAHLSAADRQAILEILVETKANLPAYWRAKTTARAGGRR